MKSEAFMLSKDDIDKVIEHILSQQLEENALAIISDSENNISYYGEEKPDIKTLSEYRLNRAKEDLEAARGNHQLGFYKVAINRSYYAIFHAIRAVNIWDGFDASKHSSVIAHFNQFYVHEGKFDRDTYKLIDSAYRIREKCDYSDFL